MKTCKGAKVQSKENRHFSECTLCNFRTDRLGKHLKRFHRLSTSDEMYVQAQMVARSQRTGIPVSDMQTTQRKQPNHIKLPKLTVDWFAKNITTLSVSHFFIYHMGLSGGRKTEGQTKSILQQTRRVLEESGASFEGICDAEELNKIETFFLAHLNKAPDVTNTLKPSSLLAYTVNLGHFVQYMKYEVNRKLNLDLFHYKIKVWSKVIRREAKVERFDRKFKAQGTNRIFIIYILCLIRLFIK